MTDPLDRAVLEIVRFVRAGERLIGLAGNLESLVESLSGLRDLDPELGPEVDAMLDLVRPILETMQRLGTFLDARLQARIAQLTKEVEG